jgi:hypothetical protein
MQVPKIEGLSSCGDFQGGGAAAAGKMPSLKASVAQRVAIRKGKLAWQLRILPT